jgi:hypothetical protein
LLGLYVTTRANSAQGLGSLRLLLGRTDVVDNRMPGDPAYLNVLKCDRPRLPIGAFELVR